MRKITLSKRASIKLDSLLKYLEAEWSENVKNDLIKNLDESLNRIRKFPNSSKKSKYIKGLHLLVITKQTSVIYRFNSRSITIVTVFDNRMNPIRMKKIS